MVSGRARGGKGSLCPPPPPPTHPPQIAPHGPPNQPTLPTAPPPSPSPLPELPPLGGLRPTSTGGGGGSRTTKARRRPPVPCPKYADAKHLIQMPNNSSDRACYEGNFALINLRTTIPFKTQHAQVNSYTTACLPPYHVQARKPGHPGLP